MLFKVILAVFVATASQAQAGEQYVDNMGYAVSGYDLVAYHDLPAPRAGPPHPFAVPGRVAYSARYQGALFAFVSAANRDRFIADPARFAPQYDGYCAMGPMAGAKIPGNPHMWRIVDGKLYLNINGNIQNRWERRAERFIKRANKR